MKLSLSLLLSFAATAVVADQWVCHKDTQDPFGGCYHYGEDSELLYSQACHGSHPCKVERNGCMPSVQMTGYNIYWAHCS